MRKNVAVLPLLIVLAACSPKTPQGPIGKIYMDSLISNDRDAIKSLVAAGSQADTEWSRRADFIQGQKAKSSVKKIGYIELGCKEMDGDRQSCGYRLTSTRQDDAVDKGPVFDIRHDKKSNRITDCLYMDI